VCPANKEYAGRYEHAADFTEEETALLLSGLTGDDPRPPALAEKIEGLDLDSYLKLMPRNLAAVLQAGGATELA